MSKEQKQFIHLNDGAINELYCRNCDKTIAAFGAKTAPETMTRIEESHKKICKMPEVRGEKND